MSAGRVTGLQAAQVALAALLAAWQRQLSPQEYAVLLDLLARQLEQEQQRAGRWAA
ncbi:MAG: hypothetical protein KJ051_14085 [Thermoleophilia bacterium]|nr:hypothetical protein [Thermoleophilia bacterium]